MKYGRCFILLFCLCHALSGQIPSLKTESDEYSTYLIPNLENGLVLLEANQEVFQGLMKQYQYQVFQRGSERAYLSPTSRVNQMRLISKEKDQVQFLFSPTHLGLIKQLEQAIFAQKPTVFKDRTGMTWYSIKYPRNGQVYEWRIGIKMDSDKEDRMGRTWDIWSTTVIFSKNP